MKRSIMPLFTTWAIRSRIAGARLEGLGNPAQLNRVERILQMAAAQGIDVNFSTGDFGDNLAIAGFITVRLSSQFAECYRRLVEPAWR